MRKRKYKILIVDDDDLIRESYAAKFKKAGFSVETAKDGLDALDEVSKNVPDIIFTGIIMPRMTGFDLMKALKKSVKTARIPVVISSHLGRREDLKRARELGALDFIIKTDVTLDEVIDRVNRALGERFIYQISLEKDKYDAHALAKILGQDSSFVCPSCGGEVILNAEYLPQKKVFSLSASCSVCGKSSEK